MKKESCNSSRKIFLTAILILSALNFFFNQTSNAQSFVAPVLPVSPNGVFNVTNYGAIGDGAATNTAAIQTAIRSQRIAILLLIVILKPD
ncbi:MAG: hypothetical protein ACREFE_12405 [Limisphaerales bacterium]